MGMFMDQWYLILILPTVLLSLWAQIMVKSTFAKYSKQACSRGITGQVAADILLKANSIRDVKIEKVSGSLTDHYDSSSKVLRLSQPVYGVNSIAAVGVAAHETGHAIQHALSWGPLVLRHTLVPVANIGSRFGPVLAMVGIGMLASAAGNGELGMMLLYIGILLFAGAVAFYLVTLPVEFDASARAIAVLRQNHVLSEAELRGVKKVLTAAALTYVASALTAIASLLRLLLIANSRRR